MKRPFLYVLFIAIWAPALLAAFQQQGAGRGGARGGIGGPIELGPDDKPAFPDPPAGFNVRRENVPHEELKAVQYDSKSLGTRRQVRVYTPPGYILTLVGRYKGKITGWDVVNEAINDGGDNTSAATENLRQTPWLQAVGPDHLLQAFKFAREADTDVALHYNDYNIESGPKHQSSLVLLRRLIFDGENQAKPALQAILSVAAR